MAAGLGSESDMRAVLGMAMVLALAAPLGAETYSWVDDTGTYNFTEEYSRVPKKYRKKVNRLGDQPSEQAAPSAATEAAGKHAPGTANSGGEQAAAGGAAVPLFGGRSEEAWRREKGQREAELSRLEGVLELLNKQAAAPRGMTRTRLDELVKEYDETRATYTQKYEEYSQFLDSARKAGLTVEMKK